MDQNGVDSAIYSLNAALDDAQLHWQRSSQEETRVRQMQVAQKVNAIQNILSKPQQSF